jgi:hypothetical protein
MAQQMHINQISLVKLVMAIGASYSNFFGQLAGNQATDAYQSNFFGNNAGNGATNAFNSNFIGQGWFGCGQVLQIT